MTGWTITPGAPSIALDGERRTVATLTVTNRGERPDRAVMDVVTDEPAARAWFTVEEPQRPVPPGVTVVYRVELSVPPGAAAGARWFAGRVYSAETAPEESSTVSDRVAFEIPAVPAPRPRRPWWPIAVVAVLVMAVIGVVGAIVLRKGDVPVPDLVGRTVEQAGSDLSTHDLVLGGQRHRQQTPGGTVLEQAIGVGVPVAAGTPIDVVVGIELDAPFVRSVSTPSAPGAGFTSTYVWSDVPGAHAYRLEIDKQLCGFANCDSLISAAPAQDVMTTTATATIELATNDTGLVQVRVAALDDFGNPGPFSLPFAYRLR